MTSPSTPDYEEPHSARIQQDLIEALDALRDLLPLAERYLSGAPADPDNAKLETARSVLNRFGGWR